jgi:hypothetical protein
MREVEATFRDASEMTNSRAVWWSLVQIGVLVGAAVFQMRYLKVSSFRAWGIVLLMYDRSTSRTRSLDNEMYGCDVLLLVTVADDGALAEELLLLHLQKCPERPPFELYGKCMLDYLQEYALSSTSTSTST